MQAIGLELIKQLNSSVIVLLCLLILAFIVIFYVGKWAEKFKHQDDKIKHIQNLSEKVIIISTKVDLIYQFVNRNSPVANGSPLMLTPIGTDIVQKIGANEIFAKYVEKLKQEVNAQSPKNAYDIQLAAMKTAKEKLLTLLVDSELAGVKQEAYIRGILVEDVLSVFGILLRDHILREKGIPVSDVDLHEAK